jgi:hypothetical protein
VGLTLLVLFGIAGLAAAGVMRATGLMPTQETE